MPTDLLSPLLIEAPPFFLSLPPEPSLPLFQIRDRGQPKVPFSPTRFALFFLKKTDFAPIGTIAIFFSSFKRFRSLAETPPLFFPSYGKAGLPPFFLFSS